MQQNIYYAEYNWSPVFQLSNEFSLNWFILGSQAKIEISGSDGYQYPNVTITFSNGVIADVIITGETGTFTGETEEGQLCFLKGVVAGQLGSEVKLIGCLPEEDRHEEDQMTIILKAGSDSGWYSAYYATPQDDFITVKKIRNKKNVSGKLWEAFFVRPVLWRDVNMKLIC